jgi:hypothetical protein
VLQQPADHNVPNRSVLVDSNIKESRSRSRFYCRAFSFKNASGSSQRSAKERNLNRQDAKTPRTDFNSSSWRLCVLAVQPLFVLADR